LNETDSTFREHTNGFTDRDDIPNNVFNKSYFIGINSVDNNEHAGNYVKDTVSVRVDIFFKGYRNVQSSLDDALDLANTFRLKAVNPSKVTDLVKFVDCTGIEIEHLANNDNDIILTLNFLVTAIFAVA
jgi:hypothetical protein